MVDALTYKKDYTVGEFARIRSGKYKGDLVQVVEDYAESCKIKAIPRLENNERKKFDPDEYRKNCNKKDNGYYYNRDFYKDGFLYKFVMKNNLNFETEPSYNEVLELHEEKQLNINDKVIVKRGDYKNRVGNIRSIFNGIAIVYDMEDTFEIDANLLERYIQPGDNISYKGENGVVLKVQSNNRAIIGINNMNTELEVNINDLENSITRSVKPAKLQPIYKSRNDPMIKKIVKIKTGKKKGLSGVVKDVYKEKYKIQLFCNMEFVNVNSHDVILEGSDGIAPVIQPRTTINRTMGMTPMTKTPGYNNTKTPNYGQSMGYNKSMGYNQSVGYANHSLGYNRSVGYNRSMGYANQSVGYTGGNYQSDNLTTKKNSLFFNAVILVDGNQYELEDVIGDKVKTRNGREFSFDKITTVQPLKFGNAVILRGENAGIEGVFLKTKEENNIQYGQIKTTEDVTY